MNDLAARTIEAHGGLDAWRRYTSVRAHLSQGGGLWGMKANGAQIAGQAAELLARYPALRARAERALAG